MRGLLTNLLLVAILAGTFVALYRVGNEEDDPAWEEQWSALSPTERTRLARAARSGSLLASQEEIELAAGFARRDRRRRAPYTLGYAVRFPLGLAFLVGGILADSPLFIVAGSVFIAAGARALRADNQVARGERETIAYDRRL